MSRLGARTIPRRLGITALALMLAGCARAPKPPEVQVGATPSARLARSIDIIRGSTAGRPAVLRVLFYGQSITSTRWTDLATAHLRATYPNTRFVVRNMAIGGFAAPLLERTVARDVAEFYPDLIVFHVYGDTAAYERIIRIMRSQTAAEIIVQDDHVVDPVEPLCAQGLHLSLHPLPGCRGFLWMRQHSYEEDVSSRVLPDLARQYGLALERRRAPWNAYLAQHHLAPAALLADPPHPNAAGWQLMARLFDAWFDRVVEAWRGEPQRLVTDRPLPQGQVVRLGFTGNRVEIIASGPLTGRVRALIDGKPPETFDGCWQTSRTSVLPGVPDWPALRQVTIDPAFHRPERWTATITQLSPKQDDFTFRIIGAGTGPDGEGHARQDFVSPSGRIRIAAKDWVIPDGVALKQRWVPEGFRVTWERHLACGDQPTVHLTAGRVEVRHIIATGIPNAAHRLSLSIAPEVRAAVGGLRTYRPPLSD